MSKSNTTKKKVQKAAKKASSAPSSRRVAKAKPVARVAAAKPVPKNDFRLRPLGDRAIIRETRPTELKTASGIILPESTQEKDAKRGVVVATGPGRYEDGILVPMGIEAGDVVLYNWGEKVTVDGVDYVVVREGDVTAIVRE